MSKRLVPILIELNRYPSKNGTANLKVLSSEMDPVKIRLIR
jgi:hypothetical protein